MAQEFNLLKVEAFEPLKEELQAAVAADLALTEQARTAANTSKVNAATSETNAANSATNASNSATAANTSRVNAGTSETNASNSATAAATSATNAGASATAAANSATAANTSRINAATSETNAGNSATAAGTSATSAANSATAAGTSAAAAALSAQNLVVVNNAVATTLTIDMALRDNQFHYLTLTGNTTLTLTNIAAGRALYLKVIQGGAGSFMLTFPGSVLFPGAAAIDWNAVAGKANIFTLVGASGTVVDATYYRQ